MRKLKSSVVLLCFLSVNGFADPLYCPQTILIDCPANTQHCSIVASSIPAPWQFNMASTDIIFDKETIITATFLYGQYIDNPQGAAATCNYTDPNNMTSGGSIGMRPSTWKAMYPGGYWKDETIPPMTYPAFTCSSAPAFAPYNSYRPMPTTNCPWTLASQN